MNEAGRVKSPLTKLLTGNDVVSSFEVNASLITVENAVKFHF